MVNDVALKSLERFTEDFLMQLRDNKTMFATAMERGMFRASILKKRVQIEDLNEKGPASRAADKFASRQNIHSFDNQPFKPLEFFTQPWMKLFKLSLINQTI